MEKMAALRRSLDQCGMLVGSVQAHVAADFTDSDADSTDDEGEPPSTGILDVDLEGEADDEDNAANALQADCDVQPADGDHQSILQDKVSDVKLAACIRVYSPVSFISFQ